MDNKMLQLVSVLIIFQTILNLSTAEEVDVWPHPQYVKTSAEFLAIDSNNFEFIDKSEQKCKLLVNAIDRTRDMTFIQDCLKVSKRGGFKFNKMRELKLQSLSGYKGFLNSLIIEVKKCEDWPHLEMNENYTLGVNTNKKEANIKSDTIWGAIRALETFSQLVSNVGNNHFIINSTEITDFPRFGYRGLLIDTSRHYIPVNTLLKNLDAMSYNKLNVFHWHIVDDQSFPFVSQTFPELSLSGSYDPITHVYTAQDVHDVIQYARQRGIRVVVEFDTPGHTLSWGKGEKGLLTECYTNGTFDGTYGPLDPSKDKVYNFIEQLFEEVTHSFKDQYFHLGGDEVDFECWQSNPKIKEFMAQKQIKTYSELESYYMQKVLAIVKKMGKSYIIWEEVFNNGVELKQDTVVHVWKGSWGEEKEKYWRSELRNVTEKGFRAILSSCWYLDLVTYGADWKNYYTCEPLSFNGTAKQNELVIGGEAAIWTEYINAANLISRTWPRASATAERLWSPRHMNDTNWAQKRFHSQNCRLMERGLEVEPNDGPGFCRCDYAI